MDPKIDKTSLKELKAKISKISFPPRREHYFWGSGGFQIQQNSKKNQRKKLEVFQITLGIDFLWILERFWLQVGSQNAAKIDIKGCWKMLKKWWSPGWRKNWILVASTARETTIPEPRGGVPPYCTGHTPTPPRRLIPGAPFALRKVSASQVGNFLDFDVTLE